MTAPTEREDPVAVIEEWYARRQRRHPWILARGLSAGMVLPAPLLVAVATHPWWWYAVMAASGVVLVVSILRLRSLPQ